MSRHVSAERLALYQEGELSARRAARVEAHLAGCESCARTAAGLAAVPLLLAEVRQPLMPDPVADRVQAAISAESISRSTARTEQPEAMPAADSAIPAAVPVPAAGGGAAGERGSGGRHSGRRAGRGLSSPLLLRGLAAAGAVAVVIVVGFTLARSPSSTSGGSSGQASSAGPATRNASGRRTETARLSYSRHGEQATTAAVASDANLTEASLPGAVSTQLSRTAGSQHFGTAGPNDTASPAPAGSPSTAGPGSHGVAGASASIGGIGLAQLSGCVSLVSAGQEVLLVEVARYKGEQAVIIVVRPEPADGELTVFVAGAGCSASGSDLITTTTVPAS